MSRIPPKFQQQSQLFGKPGSVLFGTPQKSKPSTSSDWNGVSWGSTGFSSSLPAQENSKTPLSSSSLGYLAFPPGSQPATTLLSFGFDASLKGSDTPNPTSSQPQTSEPPRNASIPPTDAADAEYHTYQTHLRTLHAQRLAREAQESIKGEEYWVSCGGVLRDEHGRRDLARTLQIREELRLRKVEARLTERWETYERRWRELVARIRKTESAMDSGGGGGEEAFHPLRFGDIPWPVERATGPESLVPDKVESFLLEPLTVRSCIVTRKDRLRSSILRWHPDKLSIIIAQTHPDEKDAVVEGINIVIRCLRELSSKVVVPDGSEEASV